MLVVAIMGNGPVDHVPDMGPYKEKVDIWIGADQGALILLEHGITIDYAVGDFDSVNATQKAMILENSTHLATYPSMKNETDLEIALNIAFELNPKEIYLFGVTGGRLDHALINMQLLQTIVDREIRGIIIDQWNRLELTNPGNHTVSKKEDYPYVSFVPFTNEVKGLSLIGFAYPLNSYHLKQGSTRCISNEIKANQASYSYAEGLLLLIQSRDTKTITY